MKNPIYQRNVEIREAKGQIPLWFIAEKLSVHENTLRNWMKKELSPERKKEIFRIIETVKSEVEKR